MRGCLCVKGSRATGGPRLLYVKPNAGTTYTSDVRRNVSLYLEAIAQVLFCCSQHVLYVHINASFIHSCFIFMFCTVYFDYFVDLFLIILELWLEHV